ncbi:MAG: DUF4115 domain-containing protein [Gammaproteobacteria bacterium]|nr:DUF4115 domain-containing protein [Gammaproteobacteria bacterium]NNJ84378.1 DUF4115 domain-containing protein [Gammaproteobacteria bacterium]
MTVPQANSHTTPGSGGGKGPGKQLREARQLRDLTIDDIAMRLRLDSATVCNLEEENYDNLPEPAFIRGYLRAYARSLGLDPEPVLSSFGDYDLTPPSLIRDIANSPQIRSSHIAVRVTTYLITFCLIALMFSWWQNRMPLSDGVVEQKPPAPQNRASNPESLSHQEVRTATDVRVFPSSNRPHIPENVVTDMHASHRPSNDIDRKNSMTRQPETDVATLLGVENFPEPGFSPLAPAESMLFTTSSLPEQTGTLTTRHPKVTSDVPMTPQAVPEMDHLMLYLSEDCWLEIYDGYGKKLYYQTGFGGKTYEFLGSGPFHIMLGYARGAKVVYNGELFDHTPYIQRELAEFSLGN